MYQKSRILMVAGVLVALAGCRSAATPEGARTASVSPKISASPEVISPERTESIEIVAARNGKLQGFRVETVEDGTLIRWVGRGRELLVRGARGYEGTISDERLNLTIGGDYHVDLSEDRVELEGPGGVIGRMDRSFAHVAWSEAETGKPRRLILTRDSLTTPGGEAVPAGDERGEETEGEEGPEG